jgi:hypothetical protein
VSVHRKHSSPSRRFVPFRAISPQLLALAAVLLFCAPPSRAEYKLTSPPPDWQKILEAKRSFDDTGSLRDFLHFIFRKSDANLLFSSRTKTEFYITASFHDLTLEEILRAISKDLPITVEWGYEGGSSQPHRIEVRTGPVDLMNKKIDVSRYPAEVTLRPDFGPANNHRSK